MNLHEYQAKEVFAGHGIPIIPGKVAATAEEAEKIARELGCTVVVKAQVHTGGRGKAGGVKLAKTPEAAGKAAAEILNLTIKGYPVDKVLVVPASEISQEFYLGVVQDRASQRPVIIASAAGGVDIEQVARETPEKIFRHPVGRPGSFRSFHARKIASEIASEPKVALRMAGVIEKLVDVYWKNDASLVEINPLVTDPENNVLALDAKMVVDDNALFRHPRLEAFREAVDEHTELARATGLSYVPLEGNIGCVVNGAGLAMATMDVIKHYGGEPANFLDIGGSSNPQKVIAALRIILADSSVKAICFNIFGGITRCDDVANGIVIGMEELNVTIPLVARLTGTNEDVAKEILSSARGVEFADTMDGVVKRALVLAAEGQGD